METARLISRYRLISELFVYPGARDQQRIEAELKTSGLEQTSVGKHIEQFLADPGSLSDEEYVATIELSPPCPLYVGSYIFDEPSTCLGVGLSSRNAYMVEVTNVYRHFGVELETREMVDFLPIMVDFLAISLEMDTGDPKGLRRWFLESCLAPGLKPLGLVLQKYESPYTHLIDALRTTLDEDVFLMGNLRAWAPPLVDDAAPVNCLVRLDSFLDPDQEPGPNPGFDPEIQSMEDVRP